MAAAVRGLMDTAIALSFAAIVATVVITLADVVLRSASWLSVPFTGYRTTWAVEGVVDLSQLLIMAAAGLAIAVAFFFGKHVTIDLIDTHLPPVARLATAVLSALLSLGFIVACLWFVFGDMQTQREMNTISATLAIPYLYYALPLLAGLALSVVAIVARLAGVRTDDLSVQSDDAGGPPAPPAPPAGPFDV
ncbi:MAG: TRAP transporter small permease subunit [Xanthobacteraceae bacterium]